MTGCVNQALPRIDHMFDIAPTAFIVLWVIGFILSVLSLAFTHRQQQKLRRHAATLRRDLYVDLMQLGPVICVFSYLSMVFPRAIYLFDTAQAVVEARALFDFGMLIINYCEYTNECEWFVKVFVNFFISIFRFFSDSGRRKRPRPT
eukprot:c6183_g1_i3.p2 GENE.c6183_g1_i3~~c6183_g1_i3.p2  ORF type:complete len:159 (-),score=20.90 c6183_g1_i3:372-812(-)